MKSNSDFKLILDACENQESLQVFFDLCEEYNITTDKLNYLLQQLRSKKKGLCNSFIKINDNLFAKKNKYKYNYMIDFIFNQPQEYICFYNKSFKQINNKKIVSSFSSKDIWFKDYLSRKILLYPIPLTNVPYYSSLPYNHLSLFEHYQKTPLDKHYFVFNGSCAVKASDLKNSDFPYKDFIDFENCKFKLPDYIAERLK